LGKQTAIVEHFFVKDNDEFVVKDFMLPGPTEDCSNHFLVRRLFCVKGPNTIELNFNPRPGYAKRETDIYESELC
jgi:hypothetical protein